jgi:hypothetical protein
MRKTVVITVTLLAALLAGVPVLWRTHIRTIEPPELSQPPPGVPAEELVPASGPSKLAQSSAPVNEAVAAVVPAQETARAGSATTVPPARPAPGITATNSVTKVRATPASVPSGAKPHAEPVMAEVVEDTDDAGLFVQLEAAKTSDDHALLLKKIVADKDRATADLLQLYQAERDPVRKAGILSAASLVEYDFNTRTLYQIALSPSEPQDLRLEAVAHAAERDRALIQSYQRDADELVRDEIASALDGAKKPDESSVLKAGPRILRKPDAPPRVRSNLPARR